MGSAEQTRAATFVATEMDVASGIAFTLSTVVVLGTVAWICFQTAAYLWSESEKHAPITGIEQYLPVRGRWLRYGIAMLLALVGVGMLALMAGMFLFRGSAEQNPLTA